MWDFLVSFRQTDYIWKESKKIFLSLVIQPYYVYMIYDIYICMTLLLIMNYCLNLRILILQLCAPLGSYSLSKMNGSRHIIKLTSFNPFYILKVLTEGLFRVSITAWLIQHFILNYFLYGCRSGMVYSDLRGDKKRYHNSLSKNSKSFAYFHTKQNILKRL